MKTVTVFHRKFRRQARKRDGNVDRLLDIEVVEIVVVGNYVGPRIQAQLNGIENCRLRGIPRADETVHAWRRGPTKGLDSAEPLDFDECYPHDAV